MNTIEEIRDAYYTHYALHGKPPSSLTLGVNVENMLMKELARELVCVVECVDGRLRKFMGMVVVLNLASLYDLEVK